MNKLDISSLLKAGVHFGHRTRYWDPKMAPYIYCTKEKVHIIDLDKTMSMLEKALNFVRKTSAQRGKIMFVGTKRVCNEIVKAEAIRCDMPYVNHRWLGGMLTNYKTVRNSIKRLKAIESMEREGLLTNFIKKEQLAIKKELQKLEENFGGIKNYPGLPDALFIVDVGRENIAVKEAKCLGIPVIGIVDTNNSPDDIDYIIPGNDDALKSVSLYVTAVADAVLAGKSNVSFDNELQSKNLDNEYLEVVEENADDLGFIVKEKFTLKSLDDSEDNSKSETGSETKLENTSENKDSGSESKSESKSEDAS